MFLAKTWQSVYAASRNVTASKNYAKIRACTHTHTHTPFINCADTNMDTYEQIDAKYNLFLMEVGVTWIIQQRNWRLMLE